MAGNKLTAKQDTLLVVRPVQSSQLLAEGRPNQVYKIPEGTVLDCARLDWYEGSNVSAEVDGDDYWYPMLKHPLDGSPVLNWYGYARHFEAEEASHPEMRDEGGIWISESRKAAAAKLIKASSDTAMSEPASEAREEDLGPTIQLPGAAFQRPRHLYEPVFWVGDKPAPFVWAELTANGDRIPQTEAIALNIVKITKLLTFYRQLLAQPIKITSGYRPPDVNRRVGGARYSRHLQGDAVDWKPMKDGIIESIWKEICKVTLGGGLAISGYDGEPEYGFFHNDLRGGGDPLKDKRGRTYWGYPNVPSWVRGR